MAKAKKDSPAQHKRRSQKQSFGCTLHLAVALQDYVHSFLWKLSSMRISVGQGKPRWTRQRSSLAKKWKHWLPLSKQWQAFLKVPGLRKQQAKQETRDAIMLLGQNMGGNLNIKSGTRAAPAAQVWYSNQCTPSSRASQWNGWSRVQVSWVECGCWHEDHGIQQTCAMMG